MSIDKRKKRTYFRLIFPFIYCHNCINCIYCSYTERQEVFSIQIFIDNKSGNPIYEQIYSQIKNQIIGGALDEDELLPSIRNLAKDLRISVITTKRAYDELEKEGFIYTVAGKGCYVAPKNVEFLREENLKKIEDYIQKIIPLAVSCNLTKNDVIEIINFSWEE